MQLTVDVPLSTIIADLDEALRVLLRRELERHGFEGVEVAFDAPSKEWSGKLTRPTVDLFLYDLREAVDRADATPTEHRANGAAHVVPPPLHLELTYAATAWTKAVEDEHRLLSQLLAILFSYRSLPADVTLDRPGAASLTGIDLAVGRPREEKADFWTSVGGQYKASIDLAAHVVIASGATLTRGPEVRTQTLRTAAIGGPASTVAELHRCAGVLRDADGHPVADAWIALPDSGRWTATDGRGRFALARVRPGSHELVARTADGREARAEVDVPGGMHDLTLT